MKEESRGGRLGVTASRRSPKLMKKCKCPTPPQVGAGHVGDGPTHKGMGTTANQKTKGQTMIDPEIAPRRDTFSFGATVGEMILGPLAPARLERAHGTGQRENKGTIYLGSTRSWINPEAPSLGWSVVELERGAKRPKGRQPSGFLAWPMTNLPKWSTTLTTPRIKPQ